MVEMDSGFVLTEQPIRWRTALANEAQALHATSPTRLSAGGSPAFQANAQPRLHRSHFKIAGPLKGDYSLAVVNRHFALALIETGCNVVLEPQENDLCEDPLFLQSGLLPHLPNGRDPQRHQPTLCVNDWPIRTPAPGQRSMIHCFGWEESIVPFELSARLSGYELVATMSNFVATSCRNSGVTSRLVNIGNGTDHIQQVRDWHALRKPEEELPFTFLHASSCFPRKGIGVLLEAYFREFSAADNVKLVIKTFDNPHNQELRGVVGRFQRQHEHPPALELLIGSLDTTSYYNLYRTADCLVAPSFGEGFLFPAAEAMLNWVPVITTNWGGQSDFCTEETAWLIEFLS